VLLQRLEDAHLGRDMDLEPLAGDEGELVLRLQVAHVDDRHRQRVAEALEGDGAEPAGELRRHLFGQVVGDHPQVVLRHRRHAELVRQRLGEAVLRQQRQLEQAGAEAAAEHLLVAQGLGQLVPRHPLAFDEELSELFHLSEGFGRRAGGPRCGRETR